MHGQALALARPGVLSAVSCRGLDVITIEGIAARGLTGPVVAQRCRAGWPILGMRGEKVAHLVAGSNTVKSARFYAAIPIGQARKAFFHNTPEILPFRPIWPGFAFDTIFYAAILWPLIIGPFALRRLIRRRRGLCPACGYDLRHGAHEVCPECGVNPAVDQNVHRSGSTRVQLKGNWRTDERVAIPPKCL